MTTDQRDDAVVLLETERLVLRRFSAADADHIFRLDNDPEVMRFINGGEPTPRAVIENEIMPTFLRYDPAAPGFGFWAAIEKAHHEFVGWFCFRSTDESGTDIILGYRLCRAYWGHGYATEGARALVDKGFAEMGVQRVVATTYEENLASRRVMEKLGMRLVRRFRLSAEDVHRSDTHHTESLDLWDGDDVEYMLEKSDWV